MRVDYCLQNNPIIFVELPLQGIEGGRVCDRRHWEERVGKEDVDYSRMETKRLGKGRRDPGWRECEKYRRGESRVKKWKI